MRRMTLLACALALAAPAVFAQAPGGTPADFLSPDAATALCPRSVAPVSLATTREGLDKSICSAAAYCTPHPSVSCATSTPGATCQAVDRNCAAGQQGFVRCGTSYTYCPPCTAACTEGTFKITFTGNCCDDSRREKERYQCIGGQWVFIEIFCGGPCGPIDPIDPQQ